MFTVNSLKKPFILDDLIFITSAENWVSEGRPIYYNGELIKGNLMLVHPPLYLYLLTLVSRIFGLTELVVKVFGVLFSVLTLLVIYFLALELSKKRKEKYFIALLASLIYAISPFVIQISLLVDIDGTILTFLMTLFIYIFIKKFDTLNLKDSIFLGFLLSVIMWTKFQGAFFILASVFIFYLLKKDFLRGLKNTFIIGVLAVSVFLLSWGVYSAIFNFPFWIPFEHNLGFLDNFNQVSPLQTIFLILWSVKNLLFWMTPTFFILVLVILLRRITSYIKLKRLSHSDFLLVYSFIIMIFFTFMQQTAYGFPKYFIPIMPVFSVLIADFLAGFKFGNSKKLFQYSIFLILILMLFNFFILKDPFVEHNIFFTKSITLEENLTDYLFYNLKGLLFFVPFIAAFLYFLILRYKPYKSLIISSVIVLISTCVYIDFIQAKADYSTNYAYGQRGVLEAAEYVRANTNTDDIIISPQSIAYYAKRKFYMSYPTMPEFLERFDNIIDTQQIPLIVVSPSEKLPDFSEKYAFDRTIGHFRVYKKIKEV